MLTAEQSRAADTALSTTLPQVVPVSDWDGRLQQAVIVFGRLMLGVLFLTQLSWKVPPSFGCDSEYTFTTADTSGNFQRGQGLCDWIGLESFYADKDRPVLGVNIRPLAQLNGLFIDTIVKPNIRWFGYLIFLAEALIVVSMLLGVFTRLGALIAIGLAAQLLIGLANIPTPYEWEWSYILMVVLAIVMFGLAPGRILGLDRLLRPRLWAQAQRGGQLSRLALLFT